MPRGWETAVKVTAVVGVDATPAVLRIGHVLPNAPQRRLFEPGDLRAIVFTEHDGILYGNWCHVSFDVDDLDALADEHLPR
jgi:hypothetical protein